MSFNGKKILIIHDRFEFRGGAERLILILAQALGADICTEFWQDDDTFPKSMVPQKLYILDQGNPSIEVLRYFRAQFNFLFKTRKFINDYDVVIFSGNNCLTASINLRKDTARLMYCHSPVRYVYDLFDYRRKNEAVAWKRFFYYDVGKWLIRGIYIVGLKKFNIVLANSVNTKSRLQKFCNKESLVVYPPIMIDTFTWRGQGDYYLSFGRLNELKRVDDIVKAFQRMPNRKLKVISGGDQLEYIKNLAKGYDNIEVLGWVDNATQEEMVGNCIATIYIPINEDFGMSPVESMAAGKPCIGVDEGGLKETIIEEKTGVLLPQQYVLEDLIGAVKHLTPERALAMKQDCIEHAKHFSDEHFVDEMKKMVNNALLQ